jgi:hypothetical protein
MCCCLCEYHTTLWNPVFSFQISLPRSRKFFLVICTPTILQDPALSDVSNTSTSRAVSLKPQLAGNMLLPLTQCYVASADIGIEETSFSSFPGKAEIVRI